MADAFAALLAAMREELVALDLGTADGIEAATLAKSAALDRVRHGAVYTTEQLTEARALNALASSRVNMMIAGVDRRLRVLAGADGRSAALCYGRDGRAALR